MMFASTGGTGAGVVCWTASMGWKNVNGGDCDLGCSGMTSVLNIG